MPSFLYLAIALTAWSLGGCEYMTSMAPVKHAPATLLTNGPSIPTIAVPPQGDTSGTTGSTPGGNSDFAFGMIHTLKAIDFPVHSERYDLSGTVARMALKWKRKTIDQKTIVNIRRWGPFHGSSDLNALILAGADKFKCPEKPSLLRQELLYDKPDFATLIPALYGTPYDDAYAQKFAVLGSDLNSANKTFYPQTVAHFVDSTQLPLVEIPETFAFDGDRNLSGATTLNVTNGMENANYIPTSSADTKKRRELELIPDANYVYMFCVGTEGANNTYTWELNSQSLKVFRPVDLEAPRAPTALKANEFLVSRAQCVDTYTNQQRQGELVVTVNLPVKLADGTVIGGDRSLGRLSSGRADIDQVVEVHYITKKIDDPTVFKVGPNQNVLTNLMASVGKDAKGFLLDTSATETAAQALDRLIRDGQTQFKFRTMAHTISDAANTFNNTLVKDYLGATIPASTAGHPSVRVAFEIVIKDRSFGFNATTNYNSLVWGQKFSSLIFEGKIDLPVMTGGTFIRGETTNAVIKTAAHGTTAAVMYDPFIYNDDLTSSTTCDQ